MNSYRFESTVRAVGAALPALWSEAVNGRLETERNARTEYPEVPAKAAGTQSVTTEPNLQKRVWYRPDLSNGIVLGSPNERQSGRLLSSTSCRFPGPGDAPGRVILRPHCGPACD